MGKEKVKAAKPKNLTSSTLEKLVEGIDRQSEKQARVKWGKIVTEINKLKEAEKVNCKVLIEAVRLLEKHDIPAVIDATRPPLELIESEREEIIKTVITGCPF